MRQENWVNIVKYEQNDKNFIEYEIKAGAESCLDVGIVCGQVNISQFCWKKETENDMKCKVKVDAPMKAERYICGYLNGAEICCGKI